MYFSQIRVSPEDPPREAVQWKEDFRQDREVPGDKVWTGENPEDGVALHYHLASAVGDSVTLRVTDPMTGEVVRELAGPGSAGLSRVQWDLRGPPEVEEDGDIDPGDPVEPGLYRVTLETGGMTRTATVRVLEDVWMMETP